MGNEASGSGSQRGGSGNFSNDTDKANEAGRKGGEHLGNERPDKSQHGGSGNFANDPDKTSDAGRKGGEHSQGGR